MYYYYAYDKYPDIKTIKLSGYVNNFYVDGRNMPP